MVVVDEENILRIFIMCVNIKIISFSFRLRINLIHVCKSTFALIYWHIKYFIYIHEFVYVCVCARLCTRSRKNECWKKIGKIKELQRGKSSHTTHAISYDSYRARTPFWLQFFKSLFLHTTRFFDYMAISVMFMCVDVFFFSISKKKNCSSLVTRLSITPFFFVCGDFYQNVKLFRRRCVVVKMDMLDT